MRLKKAERRWALYPLNGMMSLDHSCVDYLSGSSGESVAFHIYQVLLTQGFRLSSTRASLIALFCTFSEAFDVPVYWPILVMYFFVLFVLTMRRQIQYVST